MHLFSAPRPTPLLSFAVRILKADCGIVITASHNPKIYNGYKVYGPQGQQLLEAEDSKVAAAIAALPGPEVIRSTPQAPIHVLGPSIEQLYLERTLDTLKAYGLLRIPSRKLKMVYSSLHGTGISLLPALLQRMGYTNNQLHVVSSQASMDGQFPTISSPNPEEKEALSLAIAEAHTQQASLVMATDPDADRLGIAIREADGQFIALNGNQTAALILDFLLRHYPFPSPRPLYIVKTIVTTRLLESIAHSQDIECYNTLTGFKYIASVIEAHQDKKQFLFAAEESHGYLIGDQVRDKDAISIAAIVALICEEAEAKGLSLLDQLISLHSRFGLYEEALHTLTLDGPTGASQIEEMMTQWRQHPPQSLGGLPLLHITDYQKGYSLDLHTQQERPTQLPRSNVLQLSTSEALISLRPSGTEAKLKAYFSLHTPLLAQNQWRSLRQKLQQQITRIKKELFV